MNWRDWQSVKENLLVAYTRTAQCLLLANMLLFLVACLIAGELINPAGYIEFLNHCCHWRAGNGGH